MKEILTKYKGILTVFGLILPIISATGSGGWWAYNNVVFKPDLDQSENNLTKQIFRVQIETLRIRKTMVQNDIEIYKNAIEVINNKPVVTPEDKQNKTVFRNTLRGLKNDLEKINNDISSLSSYLLPG
jgi:hypothetical protein